MALLTPPFKGMAAAIVSFHKQEKQYLLALHLLQKSTLKVSSGVVKTDGRKDDILHNTFSPFAVPRKTVSMSTENGDLFLM